MGDALDLLASMVLDDSRSWGDVATSWQIADARAVLEPDPGAPRLHWAGRPKGGSKSTDIAGMSLVWALTQAAPLEQGYVVASDEEQAVRLLDRARGLVARTPGLASRVKVEARRIVVPSTGVRLVAMAADAPGAEGVLTSWIACDELPNWADTSNAKGMWTAMVSAVPKRPGCRLVVIGHAGRPGSWQHRIFERSAKSSAWRLADVAGPLPWVGADLLAEQEAVLLPSEYQRRHLNQWVAAEDNLAKLDDIRACVTHDGALPPVAGVRYRLGLDIGLTNDRTVLSVAHVERDGTGRRVVLDHQQVWIGTRVNPVSLTEVEAAIMAISRDYHRAPLTFDPYQAAQLTERLNARGLQTEPFTFSQASVGRLALTMFGLLRSRRLALPNDEALIGELAAVKLRETSPGCYRIDHDRAAHDDRAISLALVAHQLLEHSTPRRARVRSTAGHNVAERPSFIGGHMVPPGMLH